MVSITKVAVLAVLFCVAASAVEARVHVLTIVNVDSNACVVGIGNIPATIPAGGRLELPLTLGVMTALVSAGGVVVPDGVWVLDDRNDFYGVLAGAAGSTLFELESEADVIRAFQSGLLFGGIVCVAGVVFFMLRAATSDHESV